MAHEFRTYAPDQVFLFPPSPRDWLPEDHLAYQVLDVISQLDMSLFLAGYSTDGRGAPAYSPVLMTSVLLYGWCRHVYSSRKLEALCYEDVGARVIAAGHQPDHQSINLFRLHHGAALSALFEQSVSLCRRAGLVSLVHVAIDGTKVEAGASKRKAMSYGRMVEEETRIQAEIDGYLRRAREEDAAEDALFGPDQSGPGLPDELRCRENRLAKIREAKAALEAEAQAAAEAKQKERADKEARAGGPLPGRKPNMDPDPKESAQRSFTDADSRIMKGADGAFLQAYNGQAAVDEDHQVILACELSQDANDKRLLLPLVEQTLARVGVKPDTVLADPGYYSEQNVTAMEALGVKALIPPDKERCGTPSNPAQALSEEALASLSSPEKMRHLISTSEGRDSYRRRKHIVEPVFGQMKGSAGNPGYLGFLRRGLTKCTEEWHWLCARHNIMKFIRFQRAQKTPPATTNTSSKVKASTGQGPDCAYCTVPMAI
jgi:transposase